MNYSYVCLYLWWNYLYGNCVWRKILWIWKTVFDWQIDCLILTFLILHAHGLIPTTFKFLNVWGKTILIQRYHHQEIKTFNFYLTLFDGLWKCRNKVIYVIRNVCFVFIKIYLIENTKNILHTIEEVPSRMEWKTTWLYLIRRVYDLASSIIYREECFNYITIW